MSRLVILVALAMALALALPDTTEAATFNEVKKLTASDADVFDRFGHSVAVSGDVAVVGAYWEDSGGSNAGAAYVYERSQGGVGNWGEVKKLIASDAEAGDFFGSSVAIDGDTAVVGASREGAAYVFQRNQGGAGNWGEVKKLVASDAQFGDRFGNSVAVSGDIAVVGAFLEDAGGLSSGAAYVFHRNQGGAGNWGELIKLTASDAQAFNHFGTSVSVTGDTAVVGASREGAGGVDGGAAYVFQRDPGGPDHWGEVKRLAASDAQSGDRFGTSVAVSGNNAVVGAFGADTGIFDTGAAYMFGRDQGGVDNWGEVKKLTASDAQNADFFGWSVSASGDTAVVGAIGEDIGKGKDGGSFAGAAYVFDLLLPKSTPTPTRTPDPVGGIPLDSDLRSLPLETANPDRSPWGIAVGIAAVAILAVTLAGTAWYARRRRA